MNQKHSDHCSVVLSDNTVMVIGGKTGGGVTNNVEAWKVSQEFDFQPVQVPNMKHTRQDHGCAVISINNQEVVIVAGGWLHPGHSNSVPVSSVELLLPQATGWTDHTSLPRPLQMFSFVFLQADNLLLAIGGDTDGTGVTDMVLARGQDGEWREDHGLYMRVPRHYHTAVVVDTSICQN